MKKLFTFSLMVLLLVGVASAAWAGAAEEIAEAVQQRIHAFTEGNLEAWMAWYTDDAVVTNSTGPFRIEGKEALRTYYVGFFQAYPTRRVMSRHQLIRVYNGDTTAVTNAYLHITLVDRNGQANTLYLRSSFTFVKQGGRWLVADAHTSRLPTSP